MSTRDLRVIAFPGAPNLPLFASLEHGWFSEHDAISYYFAMTGGFPSATDERLGEFANTSWMTCLVILLEQRSIYPQGSVIAVSRLNVGFSKKTWKSAKSCFAGQRSASSMMTKLFIAGASDASNGRCAYLLLDDGSRTAGLLMSPSRPSSTRALTQSRSSASV